jgi:hypothetical protein
MEIDEPQPAADPLCRVAVPDALGYATLYQWLTDYAVVPTPGADADAMACDPAPDAGDAPAVLHRSTIVVPAPIHGDLCAAFNLPPVPVPHAGQSAVLLAFPGQPLCLLPYFSGIDYHAIACRRDDVRWSTLRAAVGAPPPVRSAWSTHAAREAAALAHLALAYEPLIHQPTVPAAPAAPRPHKRSAVSAGMHNGRRAKRVRSDSQKADPRIQY